MKHRERAGRFWAGAICALLASWLAFALIVIVARMLLGSLNSTLAFWACVAWCLASLLLVSFAAGTICAFFWHRAEGVQTLSDWGAWFLLILLAPLLALGPLAILPLIPLYALLIVPLLMGLERGAQWWRHRRWRHFAGLSNDWERDEGRNQKSDAERDSAEES